MQDWFNRFKQVCSFYSLTVEATSLFWDCSVMHKVIAELQTSVLDNTHIDRISFLFVSIKLTRYVKFPGRNRSWTGDYIRWAIRACSPFTPALGQKKNCYVALTRPKFENWVGRSIFFFFFLRTVRELSFPIFF